MLIRRLFTALLLCLAAARTLFPAAAEGRA